MADRSAPRDADKDTEPGALQLQSVGLTLLGVVLSIGFTVGLGLGGPWWVRLLAGLGTVLLLVALIGFGARPGRGPIARLAKWLTHAP